MKPYATRTYALYDRSIIDQVPVRELRAVSLRTLSGGGGNKGNFVTPTPFSYDIARFDYYKGSRSSTVSNGFYSYESGVLDGSVTYVGPIYDRNAVNTCYNNLLGKLNERVQGNLNLAVSVGEGRETAKMLNLVARYTRAMVDMKRSYLKQVAAKVKNFRNRRRLKKYLRKWQQGIKTSADARSYYMPQVINKGLVSRVSALAANGWLEFTYGWKPLISDIYGAADKAVRSVYNRLSNFKVRAQVRFTERFATQNSRGRPVKGEHVGGAKMTMGLTLINNYDPGLAQFTSLNPLGIAYELVPFSFVIDWFYDIGGFMSNYEASLRHGAGFKGGYLSQLYYVNSSAQCVYSRSGRAGVNTFFDQEVASSALYRRTFSRSLLARYPIPKRPTANLSLGSSRLLSAAALLRQLI